MMINYSFILLSGVLISTTVASDLDDASRVESEQSLNYRRFDRDDEDKFARLIDDFEKSYDAKQAKQDKKRSKVVGSKAFKEQLKASKKPAKASSLLTSPKVKVISPRGAKKANNE